MTSVNTSSVDRLVASFKQLAIDDQIAALGYIYQEIGGTLPSLLTSVGNSKAVQDLLKHVLELREGNQLQFLQDVLSERDSQHAEVALDPHPSKALLELIPGDGVTAPSSAYEQLKSSERLIFWYKFANKMSQDAIAMPTDYALSAEAKELLTSLKSISADEQLKFLSQIV